METDALNAVHTVNDMMWQHYYDKRIYFSVAKDARLLNGKNFSERELAELLAKRNISLEEADRIVTAIDPQWFKHGAIIDLEFLSNVLQKNNVKDYQSGVFQEYISIARVKLQGTDGIRGRTEDKDVSYQQALDIFLKTHVITPAFLGLTAKALERELLDNRLITLEDTCVLGEDGRDFFATGRFAQALLKGFSELGLHVYNAGVIPTPGIPLYSYYSGSKIGAILTASHNPSNQNGIKYIFEHFKLLNDGPAGEYGVTAYMYRIADADDDHCPEVRVEDVHDEAITLLHNTNIAHAGFQPGELQGMRVVYDGANGAYSPFAPKVLAELKVDYVAINIDPQGHNINQHGGVGEIEGHPYFDGNIDQAVFDAYLPSLKLMFAEGRKQPEKLVAGIVNDGDGDRGYLLVYSKQDDKVYVIPGDEVATWVALGRKVEGRLKPDSVVVNSVESDIMASYYVQQELGLQSITACVGDKYLLIPAREGKNHVVGCEESGHVTFGVEIENRQGQKGMIYTGNGLLSILYVIGVIAKQQPPLEKIVHPFPEGAKEIRYVYFVDKSRFYHESEVWQQNRQTILVVLNDSKPEGYTVKVVDFEDDPHMLYIGMFNAEGLKQGAIFVRNSGTEIKTGVTIRCVKALHPLFHKAMLTVHEQNQTLMKDESNPDAQRERVVLTTLQGPTGLDKIRLKTVIEHARQETLSDPDFDALLFAMRKEHVISQRGNWIVLFDNIDAKTV